MPVQEQRFHNARIFTGTAGARPLTAMSVRSGRVVEVGGEELLGPQSPPATDLGGRFVSPGLIDAHLHLLLGGESLSHVDLSAVRSRSQFMALLAQEHKRLPEGRWLIASGWSESRWGGQPPDQSWLGACGDRPVVCWRMDHHSVLVNDAVLERIGLPADAVVESEGGRVIRDGGGQATGVLQEAAAWNWVVPAIPSRSDTDRDQALLAAKQHCLSLGLTGVRTMEYGDQVRRHFLPARSKGGLRVSVVLLDRTLPLCLDWIDEIQMDDWFRMTGCKSFLDGTLGSRTARLLSPYADDPHNSGVVTEHLREGTLESWVAEVVAGNLAPVMHAIGDAAVEAALKVVRTGCPNGHATIEHAQILTESVLRLIRDMPGVRLSMQPLHRADDAPTAINALGPDRAGALIPLASVLACGARLSFGSDWPVVSADPLAGMAAAITGRDVNGEPFHPEQCIGIESALLAYTSGAAEACQLEGCGQLCPGSHADFVIWSQDPFEADWLNHPPTIEATFIAGKRVAGVAPPQEVFK